MSKRNGHRLDHLDSSVWNSYSRRNEATGKRRQFRNGVVLFGLVLGLPAILLLYLAAVAR